MRIKFKAKTMREYKGYNGSDGLVEMKAGDTAEVSDAVGQILCQRFSQDFELVIEEKPKHAPKSDKMFRKGEKTETK